MLEMFKKHMPPPAPRNKNVVIIDDCVYDIEGYVSFSSTPKIPSFMINSTYLHYKPPTSRYVCIYSRDLRLRRRIIEDIEQCIYKPLREQLYHDVIIGITPSNSISNVYLQCLTRQTGNIGDIREGNLFVLFERVNG